MGRPQPGRIDCPFVGLGDRPPQIYNPIILADGDGWTTTKAELAPAAVTLSRAHPQRAYVNDNASSTSYIYISRPCASQHLSLPQMSKLKTLHTVSP